MQNEIQVQNAMLNEFRDVIDRMEYLEAGFKIENEIDAKEALSMALQSRKIEKTLETSRVEITKPHLDFQRAINKLVKDLQKKLDQMENNLQHKIVDWVMKQNSNPFTRVDEIEVEDGTFFWTKKWDFRMIDEDKLTREYLIPNEAAIKEAIKNGVRNIPGIEIFDYKHAQMRIKN